MNFSKSFYSSFVFILILATFLALAGIKGFSRLAPTIDNMNKYNTQSLYYAEKMMSALTTKKDFVMFENALLEGKKNITEKGESEVIQKIEKNYKQAFTQNYEAKENIVDSIIELSSVNRIAMSNAALKAKKMSSAGAWVILFLTILTWSFGLILMKTLSTNLVKPLAELIDVLIGYTAKNNKLRRCPKIAPNKDFQIIYDEVNKLLDRDSYRF